VVVGGGHNGLVAATYLSQAGQSVLLLERAPDLGGATTSKSVFPGMDARLSRYSYLVSLLSAKIVRELGLRFAWSRRAIATCAPYRRGSEHHALLLSHVDEARSHRSLLRLTHADDVRGYERFQELERTLARLVWPSLLQPLRSRDAWMRSLATPIEREAWESFVERPLGETIEAHFQNDILRGIVLTDGKIGVFTHAHDPSLLQNRCFTLHVIGGGTGEWHVPLGGMGALVDALADAARSGGVQLVAGACVQTVHPGTPHHCVTFHHRDVEHEVEATRVLINAGPQIKAQLLGASYSPRPSDEGSVCKVNMLLRRLPRLRAADVDPRDAFAGTFRGDESYTGMQTSYEQAAGGEMPERLPFEMYCHTLTDTSILGAELRDAGYHTLTLFGLDMPYRLFERANERVKAEALSTYLRRLDDVLADSIEECVAADRNGTPCIEIKSPVDLERELAMNCGNIFHGELSWFFAEGAGAAGTWGVETGRERIYNCGSSAVRGGAVSGIPGRNAAQCIIEELRKASIRA
jgi:phytoene dehydrogenase-like protein